MLSKKPYRALGGVSKQDMVYDSSRRKPVKPPALWTFRRENGWTTKDKFCRCPHCEGTGFHPEDQKSEHDVKCDTCAGSGKITEGELTEIYFQGQAEYRIALNEWSKYSEIVRSIKKKLDKREKVFLGLTEWYETKEDGMDHGRI
jgi:hypothetical protein